MAAADQATANQFADKWTKVLEAQEAAAVPASLRDDSMVSRGSQSPWATIFKLFSADNVVPSELWGTEAWSDYFKSQVPFSIALLSIGVIVFIILVVNLMCIKKPPKGERPSLRPIWTAFGLGAVAMLFGVGMTVGRGMYSFNIILGSLDTLQPDLVFIRDKIEILQPEFHNAAIWMKDWQESCVGWSQIKPMLPENVTKMNTQLQEKIVNISYTLYSVDLQVRDVPEIVHNVKTGFRNFARDYRYYIIVGVFLPSLLALIVGCCISCTVVYEADFHPNAMGWANFCMLDLGAIPIGIIVLLIAAVCAGVGYVGTTMGSFCSDPEMNTINAMSAFQNGNHTSSYTKLVSFYLTGKPDKNPIIETLTSVENTIKPLAENLWLITPALDLLGLLCGRTRKADLSTVVGTAIPAIHEILPIAKRDNIYKQYNTIVVEGLCGQFTGAVGWYLTCQAFAGIFLLPYIAILAHRYMLEYTYEQKKLAEKKEKEEEAKLLEESKVDTEAKKPRGLFTCCRSSRTPNIAVY